MNCMDRCTPSKCLATVHENKKVYPMTELSKLKWICWCIERQYRHLYIKVGSDNSKGLMPQ